MFGPKNRLFLVTFDNFILFVESTGNISPLPLGEAINQRLFAEGNANEQ